MKKTFTIVLAVVMVIASLFTLTACNTCDHVWGNGDVTKAPTCKDEGVRTYTCAKCGDTKTAKIDPTGEHTWDSGKVDPAPTCNTAGKRTLTCTVCGETKTEDVAATGQHSWDNGQETTPATCGTKGVKTYTCTACGTTKTEDIPATGEHTYGELIPETDTEVAHYQCSVCKRYFDAQKNPLVSIEKGAAQTIEVTFTTKFSEAPEGYTVWLAGTFAGDTDDDWAAAKQMTGASDGVTFSVTLTVAPFKEYSYKVVLMSGTTFDWTADHIEYGKSGEVVNGFETEAKFTLDMDETVALFGGATLPYKKPVVVEGGKYILTGSAFNWNQSSEDAEQVLLPTSDPNVFSVTHTFTAFETFKIKNNADGWDDNSTFGYDSLGTVTFASGVTQVSDLVTSSEGNFCITYEGCTAEIRLNVSTSKVDIYVTALGGKAVKSDEWILVGAGDWAATTTSSTRIFNNVGGSKYELTFTFAASDTFKIKLNNPDWDGQMNADGYSCQFSGGGVVDDGTNDHNFKVNSACTLKITIDISARTVTFAVV